MMLLDWGGELFGLIDLATEDDLVWGNLVPYAVCCLFNWITLLQFWWYWGQHPRHQDESSSDTPHVDTNGSSDKDHLGAPSSSAIYINGQYRSNGSPNGKHHHHDDVKGHTPPLLFEGNVHSKGNADAFTPLLSSDERP
jgi:hypothetical protein